MSSIENNIAIQEFSFNSNISEQKQANKSNSPIINTQIELSTIKSYLKSQGLSQIEIEKFLQKYPDIKTLSDLQDKYNIEKQISKQPDVNVSSNNVEQESKTGAAYDFKGFANLVEDKNVSLKDKGVTVLSEYTKNRYLFGEERHSEKDWNNLSDSEKVELNKESIKHLLEYKKINNNIDVETLAKYLENPEKNIELTKPQIGMIKSLMSDLQTANAQKTTLENFYENDKDIRNSQKYELIDAVYKKDPEAFNKLSYSDKLFYENEKIVLEAAKEYFEKDNLKTSDDVSKFIKDVNKDGLKISRKSLVYDYLSKKQSRTDIEEKLFKSYTNLKNYAPNGNLAIFPDADSSNQFYVEMLKSETYQKAYEKNKDNEKAEDIALKAYLEEKFANVNNQADKDKLISEILGGCNDLYAQKIVKELRSIGVITSQEVAKNERVATATLSDKSNDIRVNYSDFEGCSPEYKKLYGNAFANRAAYYGYNEDVNSFNINMPVDYGQQRLNAHNGNNEAYHEEVDLDFVKNGNKYTTEAMLSKINAGGKNLDLVATEEQQNDYATKLWDYAAVKNPDFAKAYASSGSTYKGKTQLTVTNKVMEGSYVFGDEVAKEIQTALANDIQNYEVQNQLDAHNLVMTSKYSEVQECAASNIKNYDSTVQSKALDTVYKSGNQKAIEAAVASIPEFKNPEVRQIETTRAIVELGLDDEAKNKILKSFAQLSGKDVSSLSPEEKKAYYQTYFKQLPIEQKIKLISSIKSSSMRKIVYTMIARQDSHLFTEICKDKDRADTLLGLNLPVDVTNKIKNIVRFLAVSDIGFRNLAEKYDIKIDDTEEKPKTAYTLLPKDLSDISGVEYFKMEDRQGKFLRA